MQTQFFVTVVIRKETFDVLEERVWSTYEKAEKYRDNLELPGTRECIIISVDTEETDKYELQELSTKEKLDKIIYENLEEDLYNEWISWNCFKGRDHIQETLVNCLIKVYLESEPELFQETFFAIDNEDAEITKAFINYLFENIGVPISKVFLEHKEGQFIFSFRYIPKDVISDFLKTHKFEYHQLMTLFNILLEDDDPGRYEDIFRYLKIHEPVNRVYNKLIKDAA